MSPVPPNPHREPDAPAQALARATERIDAVVRLAGGVAHDFNNLLTVIAGNTQVLLDDLPGDSPLRTEIGEIAEAARRAATLTHQLLAFSRQLVMQPQRLNPGEVLHERWEALQAEIVSGVRLRHVIDPSIGHVLVDPELFGQVVVELVRNASDATRGRGTIEVELRNVTVDVALAAAHRPMTPGDYILLAVTDDGAGMDRATLARVFDPFFTTKDQKHGTGMGLPTVYGIVKQSGGFIWLESLLGRGTRCRVYLPRASTTVPALRVRPPRRATPASDRETVLVVEDEDLVRTLTRRTLERAGYRVVEAPNAHLALAMVRDGGLQPDLLLSDIVMPGMSGRELAVTLEREFPGLAVILMSGFVDQREPLAALGGGRWAFLAKPFSLDELRLKVSEALMLERSPT